MKKTTHLLWLDLETTGVDDVHDFILEVAVILTEADYPFYAIADRSWVVQTPTAMARHRMNEYVTDMHDQSGLWGEVELGGVPLDAVESEILQLLRLNDVKDHRVMLAGSGVGHFDRRFVRRHMTGLEHVLQYPNFDVGATRRLVEATDDALLFDNSEFPHTHRAADDIRGHLEEARHFAAMFKGMAGFYA